MLNNSTICIFHRKSDDFWCPDGLASAAIVHRWAKHIANIEVTFFDSDYTLERESEILSAIGRGNDIYFVDYSFNKNEFTNKLAESNKIFVLDHHKGVEAKLNTWSKSILHKIDMGRSGCQITWDFFFGGDRPLFIDYVADGDLFKFDLPDAKLINQGIYGEVMPNDKSLDEIFPLMEVSGIWNIFGYQQLKEKFYDRGVEAELKRKIRIDKLLTTAKIKSREGANVAFVEVTSKDLDIVSKLGYNLYTNLPIEYAILVNYSHKHNRYFVSFRSKEFDCLPIAQSYGGGGHKQACGCSVSAIAELKLNDPIATEHQETHQIA